MKKKERIAGPISQFLHFTLTFKFRLLYKYPANDKSMFEKVNKNWKYSKKKKDDRNRTCRLFKKGKWVD